MSLLAQILLQGQGGRGAGPLGGAGTGPIGLGPELMLLATAPPWQIPLRRDLLSQRGGTLWHPRQTCESHVWSLDGTRRF